MSTARLKLRDDAYYVKSETGVYILTHQGPLSLAGDSIHQWIDRLTPFLDGEHTRTELTAGLRDDRKELTENLITTLIKHGVVRTVHDDQPHALEAKELRAYRPEIAFAGYFSDSPGRAFERYRDSVALVLGSGRLLPATVSACLRSGLRLVNVVVTPECPTNVALLDACARGARQRDPAQRLHYHRAAVASAAELATQIQGMDLVVHVSDRPMAVRAGLLDELCAKSATPLTQAMAIGDEIWWHPVVRPGIDGPGWAAGWPRLRARDSVHRRGPHGDSTGSQISWPVASVTVAVNQLVHDVYRYTAGTRPASSRSVMTRIHLGTGERTSHSFVAHPFMLERTALDEAQWRSEITHLQSAPPLSEEEFSRGAAAVMDSRLGVFSDVTEREFAQLPVHIAYTTVADPVGLLGRNAPTPVVTGAALDFASARYQAALAGLATYASLMVDPRRLLDSDGRPLVSAGDDPRAALSALRSGVVEGWVRGIELTDGGTRLLKAQHVFPVLNEVSLPYYAPLGVAACFNYADALLTGLIQQGKRITLAEVMAGTKRFPLMDLEAALLDETVEHCITLLEATGESVAVYDVTGRLGIPTVACLFADATVAYGSGLSDTEALRDGLLQLLLYHQAKIHEEPEYAPGPVPELPPRLREDQSPRMVSRHTLDVQSIIGRLAACGHRAVVILLDDDPEVHEIMPYIVRVVVDDA